MSDVVVGSVGYSTYQGLGVLLKSFKEAGIVQRACTVMHHTYKNYDWYGDDPLLYQDRFATGVLRQFMKTVDIMFFFETPFDSEAFEFCREHNVKTVLMPMYECTPLEYQHKADLVINPSLLDQDWWPEGEFIPVPIPFGITWRQRTTAQTFVHNAGHGGLQGRNGTRELLIAMGHVKAPLKLILRSQRELPRDWMNVIDSDPRIDYRQGDVPFEELYAEGDVFVFPETFNGLSLPLQEAKASGMLIMATNRHPISTWNDPQYLIPTRTNAVIKPLGHEITASVVDPIDIAKTMDHWYGADISSQSRYGHIWGEQNSWKALRSTYVNTLMELVK